jgi:hypothetical protein
MPDRAPKAKIKTTKWNCYAQSSPNLAHSQSIRGHSEFLQSHGRAEQEDNGKTPPVVRGLIFGRSWRSANLMAVVLKPYSREGGQAVFIEFTVMGAEQRRKQSH